MRTGDTSTIGTGTSGPPPGAPDSPGRRQLLGLQRCSIESGGAGTHRREVVGYRPGPAGHLLNITSPSGVTWWE
jgi:hypothetical protein